MNTLLATVETVTICLVLHCVFDPGQDFSTAILVVMLAHIIRNGIDVRDAIRERKGGAK